MTFEPARWSPARILLHVGILVTFWLMCAIGILAGFAGGTAFGIFWGSVFLFLGALSVPWAALGVVFLFRVVFRGYRIEVSADARTITDSLGRRFSHDDNPGGLVITGKPGTDFVFLLPERDGTAVPGPLRLLAGALAGRVLVLPALFVRRRGVLMRKLHRLQFLHVEQSRRQAPKANRPAASQGPPR